MTGQWDMESLRRIWTTNLCELGNGDLDYWLAWRRQVGYPETESVLDEWMNR